ncbi:MAG TPA: DHA2 family efflux MFS transporter permease subunit [Chthoniobacterales bacterium]
MSGPPNAAQAIKPDKRVLPWVVGVALFMENLDATIINTAVPTMAASLNVPSLSLKAVLTSYMLSLAVFIPVSGWVADRFGTRRVFQAAIALFSIGSLLCGLAVNVPMLVVSRIIQGVGGAMMMPVGRVALVRIFPKSELIRAMNFVVIPALIAPLLGPFTGGMIVHWMPWRMIFFLNLPVGLLGWFFAHRFMPNFRDANSPPLDKRGFLLFGSGIALLSYVLEIFGEHSLPWAQMAGLFVISLLLLGAYGWHANRVSAPLLHLGLFKIRTFRVSVVGGCVTRLGISGMPFMLPLLYQIGLGYEPWQAGLLTIPQALAAIGMKLMTRPILARFGHRNVLVVNTVVIGLFIMVFGLVRPGTPLVMIIVLSLCQGFASALQFTSMNTLVYADIDSADASKASSIGSTAQQFSISFGVAFAAVVAAFFLGGSPQVHGPVFISALHHAFLTLGIITILSSSTFGTLKSGDGNNISNRPADPEEKTESARPSTALGA